jgi:hypothetical protein
MQLNIGSPPVCREESDTSSQTPFAAPYEGRTGVFTVKSVPFFAAERGGRHRWGCHRLSSPKPARLRDHLPQFGRAKAGSATIDNGFPILIMTIYLRIT